MLSFNPKVSLEVLQIPSYLDYGLRDDFLEILTMNTVPGTLNILNTLISVCMVIVRVLYSYSYLYQYAGKTGMVLKQLRSTYQVPVPGIQARLDLR